MPTQEGLVPVDNGGITINIQVMDYINTIIGVPFALTLFVCGVWSAFMVGVALKEMGLKKEGLLARIGGLLFIGLALGVYVINYLLEYVLFL